MNATALFALLLAPAWADKKGDDCGDGEVDPSEEACDDGNTDSDDGCSDT